MKVLKILKIPEGVRSYRAPLEISGAEQIKKKRKEAITEAGRSDLRHDRENREKEWDFDGMEKNCSSRRGQLGDGSRAVAGQKRPQRLSLGEEFRFDGGDGTHAGE